MGRYRRRLIGLAIAAVLIGGYAAAGFLAVPYYARKGLQDFVHQHYARALTVGDIRFNPFTLALDVGGFSLPDADRQPLLAFKRLHVSLELASLWRFAPSFREILLEEPYVRAVIRPDGALNLADLGKGLPPAPSRGPQKSEPTRLFIDHLAVTAGIAVFEDRTRPFRAEFKPIALELRDFSTTAETGNGYHLSASSPEGERLVWSGNVDLEPLSSHGRFEIADLKARTLWRYMRESLSFEVPSGVIALKGGYELSGAGGALALKLNVHDTLVTHLGIKPNGAAENCIDLARLEVTGTRFDLSGHALEIARVATSGGEIRASLGEGGRLNLLDLIARPAPQAAAQAAGVSGAAGTGGAATPEAPAPSPSATPAAKAASPAGGSSGAPSWRVSAPDIAIEGLKLSAEDRQVKPAATLRLEPLNVHIGGFSTAPDDTLDVALESKVNETGTVNARAKIGARSRAVSAHVEASELGLEALQPYIARYTSMKLLKGRAGAKLDIERDADGVLEVRGKAGVGGLSTEDNALRQAFVRWKALLFSDVRYRSKPQSLRIGTVTALEPYAHVVIAPDRTLNITEILKRPGSAPKSAAKGAPAPAAPFPMSIGTVRIVNASLDYADLWIQPSFAVGIETLGGTVSGLSSDPKSRAKMELEGKVDRYSPAHIGGEINLLSAALYTDATMSFKDLDLTIVNPYSSYFAGYRIDKGKLSVDVAYHIDQRRLTAQQHFVVDQIELGSAVDRPDVTHLPLKIAVALLKDRNGVIDIKLPMSGSLDDPSFRIGPLIWKAFVNLIVKAATSPFALLGHLVGGGENMNVVEFTPGSAELDPPSREQLGSVAKALKERPQLKLDVPIVSSKALDRPALAAARLREELQARVLKTTLGRKHPDTALEYSLADPERHFRLLLEQYQADLKDAPLPPTVTAAQSAKSGDTAPYDPAIADLEASLTQHMPVQDADLDTLGKQRAEAIRDAILSNGQVDPARLFIVNAPPKADAGDRVRVEMAVK